MPGRPGTRGAGTHAASSSEGLLTPPPARDLRAAQAPRAVTPLAPQARVVAVVVFVAALTLVAELGPLTLVVGGLWVALAALVFRPPARRLAVALAAASSVVVAAVLPIAINAGPAAALWLGARSLICAGSAVAVLGGLASRDLESALSALGVPALLAGTVGTLLRQLGSIVAEGKRLVLARRLRGASGFGPEALAQLLLRSHVHAERVALAASLRGYDLRVTQALGSRGAWGRRETLLVAVAALAAATTAGSHWF